MTNEERPARLARQAKTLVRVELSLADALRVAAAHNTFLGGYVQTSRAEYTIDLTIARCLRVGGVQGVMERLFGI